MGLNKGTCAKSGRKWPILKEVTVILVKQNVLPRKIQARRKSPRRYMLYIHGSRVFFICENMASMINMLYYLKTTHNTVRNVKDSIET